MRSIVQMLISGEAQFIINISTLIVILSAVWGFARAFSKQEARIIACEQNNQRIEPKVDKNTTDIHTIEVSDAENRIRIVNIEARVVEILAILKDK